MSDARRTLRTLFSLNSLGRLGMALQEGRVRTAVLLRQEEHHGPGVLLLPEQGPTPREEPW
ncbi:hypothetical protein GCM10009535_55710 [Streptomyces thermocarboxydovorans]|uniref:NUDIX hydrolase n=1 Tax=Streptomyces thermocarboxydovorans TaxID=59298 RepID=A0ABP3T1F7_9ACTN